VYNLANISAERLGSHSFFAYLYINNKKGDVSRPKKREHMYSLDCSYFNAEFDTREELIEAVMINGMDPLYEITFNGEGTGEQLIDLIQF